MRRNCEVGTGCGTWVSTLSSRESQTSRLRRVLFVHAALKAACGWQVGDEHQGLQAKNLSGSTTGGPWDGPRVFLQVIEFTLENRSTTFEDLILI